MSNIGYNKTIQLKLEVRNLEIDKEYRIIDADADNYVCEFFALKTTDNILLHSKFTVQWYRWKNVELKHVLVNQNYRSLDICQILYQISPNPVWKSLKQSMKWNEFINEDNGYVKNGVATIEVIISLTPSGEPQNPYEKLNNEPNFETFFIAEKSKLFMEDMRKGTVLNPDHMPMTEHDEKIIATFICMMCDDCLIPIFDDSVEGVLKLSVKYDCAVEKQQCEKYIIESTTIPMIQKLKYADTYQLDRLKASDKNSCFYNIKQNGTWQQLMNVDGYDYLGENIRMGILELQHRNLEKPPTYEINGIVRDFSQPDGELRNTVLRVNGVKFYANKELLENRSEVFYEALKSTDELIIEDTTAEEVNEFLQMIYQTTNPVTCANYKSLLKLAHRYNVPIIFGKCHMYLIENPYIELIDKLIYAGKYEFEYLTVNWPQINEQSQVFQKYCMAKITKLEDVAELKKSDKFNQITNDVLAEMMKKLL